MFAMLKLICKNLWARRRRNGWLMAELVLVSIVCWVVFDPVFVMTYDRYCLPLGYDADRLCMVSLAQLDPQAPGYDEAANDSARLTDDYLGLVRRAAQFEGVARTAPVLGFVYPNSMGSMNIVYRPENDSVNQAMMGNYFLPHTGFFETYGFRPMPGNTLAELSDHAYTESELVLNEEAARICFGTSQAAGKRFWALREQRDANGQTYTDTLYKPVVGTVGNFKQRSTSRPVPVMFLPKLTIDSSDITKSSCILVRLREGVSMETFLHDFRPWMVQQLRAGNLYARSVQSYEDLIADLERAEADHIYYRNLSLALFFLINLCLGVMGSFWLQTRTRQEEIGVMRSFGATSGRIIRMLLAEGLLLTSLAALVGFLIYGSYAWSEGLSNGLSLYGFDSSRSYWTDSFVQHFLTVSFLILLILWTVVGLGISLPAYRISRISPTDALRDE